MKDYTNRQGNREFSEGDVRVVVYPRCVEVHQPTKIQNFSKPVDEEMLKNFPFPEDMVRRICDGINSH